SELTRTCQRRSKSAEVVDQAQTLCGVARVHVTACDAVDLFDGLVATFSHARQKQLIVRAQTVDQRSAFVGRERPEQRLGARTLTATEHLDADVELVGETD